MEALVIVAHGSRREGSQEGMEKLRQGIAARIPYPVYLAYLQFQRPTLEEVVEKLREEGIGEITVLPAFLSAGVHVLQDIPETLQAIRRRYPELRLFLASPLGYDPRLVDILLERLRGEVWEVEG